MVKQLVVIGDSFCHGIGTASVFYNKSNTEYAFGKHVADSLGLEYVNLAEPGSNILRAAQLGYEYINQHKDRIGLLIAGWTHTHRVGFYNKNNVLQILPEFAYLGDNSDSDVFVSEANGVKFITDKNFKDDLEQLPWLHKILLANDFLSSQVQSCQMTVDCFRAWLTQQNIKYFDFNVFPGGVLGSKSDKTFEHIMNPTMHPTKEQQKQFAELLLRELNE